MDKTEFFARQATAAALRACKATDDDTVPPCDAARRALKEATTAAKAAAEAQRHATTDHEIEWAADAWHDAAFALKKASEAASIAAAATMAMADAA
jgi:hypothetical protein